MKVYIWNDFDTNNIGSFAITVANDIDSAIEQLCLVEVFSFLTHPSSVTEPKDYFGEPQYIIDKNEEFSIGSIFYE